MAEEMLGVEPREFIAALCDENDRLLDEIEELEHKHERLKEYARATMRTLMHERRYGPAEGAPGTEEKGVYRQRIAGLTHALNDLEEEYENLEATRDREVAELMTALDTLEEGLEQLTDEKEFWVREAAKYRDEADYMATEWGKLRSENNELRQRQFTHHVREMRRIHSE